MTESRVLRLTVDTSWVIAGAQAEDDADVVEELIDLARRGRAQLFVAQAFVRDQDHPENPASRREANLRWLAEHARVITLASGPHGRVPSPGELLPGGFMLDYSRLDDPDLLVTAAIAKATAEIQSVLKREPEVLPGEKALTDEQLRPLHDVQHLVAHIMSGNTAFVTADKKLLKAAAELSRRIENLRILGFKDAVELAREDSA